MSEMNIPAWVSACVAAIALVLAIGNTLYLRKTDDRKATDTKLKDQDDKIAVVEKDVAQIKGVLKNIPTTEDLHKLALKMTEMSAQMKPMSNQLTRIEEFLMTAKETARRTK